MRRAASRDVKYITPLQPVERPHLDNLRIFVHCHSVRAGLDERSTISWYEGEPAIQDRIAGSPFEVETEVDLLIRVRTTVVRTD
jgi:hypothetical protein